MAYKRELNSNASSWSFVFLRAIAILTTSHAIVRLNLLYRVCILEYRVSAFFFIEDKDEDTVFVASPFDVSENVRKKGRDKERERKKTETIAFLRQCVS